MIAHGDSVGHRRSRARLKGCDQGACGRVFAPGPVGLGKVVRVDLEHGQIVLAEHLPATAFLDLSGNSGCRPVGARRRGSSGPLDCAVPGKPHSENPTHVPPQIGRCQAVPLTEDAQCA